MHNEEGETLLVWEEEEEEENERKEMENGFGGVGGWSEHGV